MCGSLEVHVVGDLLYQGLEVDGPSLKSRLPALQPGQGKKLANEFVEPVGLPNGSAQRGCCGRAGIPAR